MLKFLKVFGRDLRGHFESALILNIDHVVKIEVAGESGEPCSILTLTTGEKLEVLGSPEDLLTHDRYFYPPGSRKQLQAPPSA